MASETEERTERAAPPRFSESESPPAWLIATRGDLREMEARVNYRIDDAKADIRTRIDDAKAETSARIDDRIDSTNTRIDDAKAETSARINDAKAETNALIGVTNARIDDASATTNARIDDASAATNTRIDELKEEGRARDAKLDAMADALSRIEANQKSESRRKQLSAAWIGIAVGALGIAAGILWNIIG